MPKDAVAATFLKNQQVTLATGSRPHQGVQTRPRANHLVVDRLPKVVRYNDPDTLKDDLIVGAGAVTYFFDGKDTPTGRRATYYQYERGNLPGAVEYGSSVAISKSLALAAMWAKATKHLDEPTKKLMELNLQLNELGAALSDCNNGQVEVAKLGALIDATREAIADALKLPSPFAKPQLDGG